MAEEKEYTYAELADISLAIDRIREDEATGGDKSFLNLLDLTGVSYEDIRKRGLDYDLEDRVAGSTELVEEWQNSLRQKVEDFDSGLIADVDRLTQLPTDILIHQVLARLSISELRAACIVNRRMGYLCNDDDVWRRLANERYSQDILDQKTEVMSWKDFVIEADTGGVGTIYLIFEPNNARRPIDVVTSEVFEVSDATFHPGDLSSIPSPANSWKLALRVFGLKGAIPVRFVLITSTNTDTIELIWLGTDPLSARERANDIAASLEITNMQIDDTVFQTGRYKRDLVLTDVINTPIEDVEDEPEFTMYITRAVPLEVESRFVLNTLTGHSILVGGQRWYELVRDGSIFLEDQTTRTKQPKIKVG